MCLNRVTSTLSGKPPWLAPLGARCLGLGLFNVANGSENSCPLFWSEGDGVPVRELRGELRGEMLFLLPSVDISSGDRGPNEPLLERERTLSRPKLTNGSWSDGRETGF